MRVVLAAVDSSAAAQPVVEVARELARLTGATVEMVYVEERGAHEPSIAKSMHLPFHGRQGEVMREIASVAHERDAIAVVVGARSVPGGTSPAGHVTIELVQALDVAVAVVPPQAAPRPIARVLAAVEGDGESHALRHLARHFRHGPAWETIALHVFEPDRLPPFGDQPLLETEAWIEEFGRRVLPAPARAVRLEVRVGDPARALREAAQDLDVDLVVLAWHRDLTHGHGRLVRHLLTEVDVPILLIPTASSTEDRGSAADPTM